MAAGLQLMGLQPAMAFEPIPAAGLQADSDGSPPLLHAAGPYFVTPSGQAVYLAGSHTWNQAQQIGPPAFTFGQFLEFESSIGGNFIRYWTWTNSNDAAGSTPDSQLPFLRSATPGANDGGNKWDLTAFNPVYFARMRSNVIAAGHKGIYVSIMLFNGFTNYPPNWLSDAFNGANNINGVDPASASAEQLLGNPALLAAQQNYVAKMIDTVGDLPNVLFEVSNESNNDAATFQWQDAIAQFVRSYETQRGYAHHPVGITAPYPGEDAGVNRTILFANPNSDWTAPDGWYDYQDDPPDAPGNKPVIVDTDHAGGGHDAGWMWKMFTRGYNLALMDPMGGSGLPDSVLGNQNSDFSADVSARFGITQIMSTVRMFDLAGMRSHRSLASTGYVLADPPKGSYVIYVPDGGPFSVDLTGASGELAALWLNIDTGARMAAGPVRAERSWMFTAPYRRTALLLTRAPMD